LHELFRKSNLSLCISIWPAQKLLRTGLKQTITLGLIAIAGCTKISHVGPKPEIYSGDASLYVLKAGVYLIEAGLADFCYLTLTDYMQPKYAPEAIESLEFYRGIDNEIGRLLSLGCIVARRPITTSHNSPVSCAHTADVMKKWYRWYFPMN